MPKPLQLHVPTPCHEDWEKMSPENQGRHCMSCQKTVVDFSNMSDRQVMEYMAKMSKTGASTCGRFYDDQLNRDIIVQPNKRRLSIAYLWNLLLATFLFAGRAEAQSKLRDKPGIHKVETNPLLVGKVAFNRDTSIDDQSKPKLPVTIGDTVVDGIKHKPLTTCNNLPRATMGVVYIPSNAKKSTFPSYIRGKITDVLTGRAIEGASVTIKNKNKGAVADSSGEFWMAGPDITRKIDMLISAVGYESKVITIETRNSNPVNIQMNPLITVLKPVTITAWPTIRDRFTTGAYTSTTMGMVVKRMKVKKATKITKVIADTVALVTSRVTKLKLYPNPVIRGQIANVSLSLKETGPHTLQLVDAMGRMVLEQPLTVDSQEQKIEIATQPGWSAGIYFLRIAGVNSKKLYQGELLIQ